MGVVARRTLSELGNALGRSHRDGNWQVPVLSASAANGTGIEALADALAQHHAILVQGGELNTRRRDYQAHWILKRLQEEFGTHGIEKLGGEQAITVQLVTQQQSLLEQYQSFRQQLLNTNTH
jgi:LAO/AO transport system kinase